MKHICLFFMVFLLSCFSGKVKESKKLLETDRAFARMSVESGAKEAFKLYMIDSALELSPNSQPVQGKSRILPGLDGDYTLEWTPRHAEAAQSGEIGYTWGTYKMTSVDSSGNQKIRYGKYMNIWKKDNMGKWKVLVDMGNSSPGPATD